METLTTSNVKENLLITNKQHPEWGTWRVLNKYDKGIWEIRGNSGTRILMEDEFHFWETNNAPKPCGCRSGCSCESGFDNHSQ